MTTATYNLLFNWHWSQNPPAEYALHHEGISNGIGVLATIHPGAFNLAWALLGGPTAKSYRKDVFAGTMPKANISWTVAGAHQGMCVHTLVDPLKPGVGLNVDHWQPITRAGTLGLGEYFAELTPSRRLGVLNMVGCDIYPYIQEAYRRKLN